MYIVQRYEGIRRPYARLLNLKTATVKAVCNEMVNNDFLSMTSPSQLDALVKNIVMVVIYWWNFNSLNSKNNEKSELLMHQGVYQVMALIAPYLSDSKQNFFNDCSEFYRSIIDV